MSKFKAFFLKNMGDDKVLVSSSNDKNKVIEELLNFAETKVDYCLDSRSDRKEALELRNTCICGCGPSSLHIEEN